MDQAESVADTASLRLARSKQLVKFNPVSQQALDDATLKAPRDGRIQYLVAQEGEIVGSGGRILSLVDLSDVYMTIFLPTSQVGRV